MTYMLNSLIKYTVNSIQFRVILPQKGIITLKRCDENFNNKNKRPFIFKIRIY